MKKEKNQKENKANDDPIQNEKVKLGERFSLTMRKKWLVNGTKTLLIVAILVAIYIALNLWIQNIDLPKFDVTENKIYTLSDASKKAVENLDQEVKIYAYGFEEDSSLIDLLKQYQKANKNISYEILTEQTNYQMIQENDLQEGYYVVILESGNSKKVIDASNEFSSYDFTTGQQVDITEQTITNSILALNVENKPKVYFVEGHEEYSTSELTVLTTYLNNEAFETETINLATAGSVPEDCDVLAIMSPTTDFLETEKNMVLDYINRGGNIYFSMDVVSQTTELPNIQAILDVYGVSVENGYILELGDNAALSSSPNIFKPQVSSSNDITADIYTDSYMWLVYSARLKFLEDDALQSLNVTKEDLLTSTDKAAFVKSLDMDMTTAAQNAEIGKSTIASIVTKTIANADPAETAEDVSTEGEETATDTAASSEEVANSITSNLVISASGSFISDYTVSALDQNYPLSYLGSNKDFVINAMAKLGEKENTLTIRKDMANSTYTPTDMQNKIVLSIIFIVPVVIVLVGIVIARFRRKRK